MCVNLSYKYVAIDDNFICDLFIINTAQLFQAAMKKGKVDVGSVEQLQMLDPFVPLLSETLSSRHVGILSLALRCLTRVTCLPLPSLERCVPDVTAHLFDLLRRYARTGAAVVGGNQELVFSAFKASSSLNNNYLGAKHIVH